MAIPNRIASRGRAHGSLPAITLILASLAFAAGSGHSAPSLRILLKTGLVTETDVGSLRKITFSATTLTLFTKAGDSAQTPLTGIEKLSFTLPAPTIRTRNAGEGAFSAWTDGPGAVRLRLPTGGRANLALFGLQGGQMRDLGVTDLTAGEHRFTLGEPLSGGPGLPPGIYLFRISVPGFGSQAVPFTLAP